MTPADHHPELIPATDLEPLRGPRMRSRWIKAPKPEGWSDFALAEWELRAAGWSDKHPHTETNVVIEGELHVSCDDGTTVIARQGDTVTVPAGATGRYWAPDYARMIVVYGPNPDAEETDRFDYWEL